MSRIKGARFNKKPVRVQLIEAPATLGRPSRRQIRRWHGPTAYVGYMGDGKTYSLASLGLQAIKRGDRVYTNHGFELPGIAGTFKTFDEFCGLEGPALVLWDELPSFVNARKWQEFPDGLLYRMTALRHDMLRLAYTAVDESYVDVNVRRVTMRIWQCHHLFGPLHYRALWRPSDFRKARERPIRRELFVIRPAVADAYDSWGNVSLFSRAGAVGELQTAPSADRAAGDPAAVVADGKPRPRRGVRHAPPQRTNDRGVLLSPQSLSTHQQGALSVPDARRTD